MHESLKRWPAIIVGGGVAGAVAAIQLARNGYEVLLLEKEEAPHDKVCGEFIAAEAQRYFLDLGVDLATSGARRIGHLALVHGQYAGVAKLASPGLSLSRRILDERLLCRAEECGAELQRGCLVTGVFKERHGWRIERANGAPLLAKTLFMATGKHDLRSWRRTGRHNDYIGFKQHLVLTEAQRFALADQIEMVLFAGGYAGLEPIEGQKANLCLVVTKAEFGRHGKNWPSFMAALRQASPWLAGRLAGARPVWPRPLSVYGIPYGFLYEPARDAPDDLYRLGDQMAVIPSLSGQGLSIAAHTALAAVEAFRHSDARTYHRRMRSDLGLLVRAASLVAGISEHVLVQKALVSTCRRWPKLVTKLAGCNRISTAAGLGHHAPRNARGQLSAGKVEI
ncbi:MAG: FAD-dependent oxidoreductase [Pseudomonadota bacterium]|nr:FAD-dependent oxidoreductase [Pseudomonadota bacterium]